MGAKPWMYGKDSDDWAKRFVSFSTGSEPERPFSNLFPSAFHRAGIGLKTGHNDRFFALQDMASASGLRRCQALPNRLH